MIHRIFAAAILSLVASSSDAATLATYTLQINGGGRVITTFATIEFGLSDPTELGLFDPLLFSIAATTADVGSSWTLTSGDAFDLAVQKLTSGNTDQFLLWQTTSFGLSGAGGTSRNVVGRKDFSDSQITGMEFTLNSFSITSPGRDPNHDGIWTDITYSADVNVYGTVIPLPAALWLLGSALGVLGVMRRRSAS